MNVSGASESPEVRSIRSADCESERIDTSEDYQATAPTDAIMNTITYAEYNPMDYMETKSESSSKTDSPGRQQLKSWLNKNMKIEMTDGRVLIGVFLCVDKDTNIILGSCSEYLQPDEGSGMEEPRVLGLVMVPGRHIVSIHLDDITSQYSQTSQGEIL